MTLLDSDVLDRRPAVSRVFDAICEQGPLARNALRRLIHASPSTVSACVQDLRELRLVDDSARGESTGGRHPTLLDLGPEAGIVLAADIGGHTLRAAAGDLRGRVLASRQRHTPRARSARSLQRAVDELLAEVTAAGQGPVRAVGVGVAGVVHPATQQVSLAVNVPGWSEVDTPRWLERFGAPVIVDNEANLAALGEYAAGAARGMQHFVFVAMGAGIGAGIMLGGEIFRGLKGAAGEIGLMQTRDLGRDAQLERQASATALAERHRELAGGNATAEEIFARALIGEQPARGLVDDVLDNLALGIANTAAILDPEAIVLGGGYARAGRMLHEGLAVRLQSVFADPPSLLLGELGPDAAIVGAVHAAALRARHEISSSLERRASYA
jgi:predicted NBD/HSP70 family sugar kinase